MKLVKASEEARKKYISSNIDSIFYLLKTIGQETSASARSTLVVKASEHVATLDLVAGDLRDPENEDLKAHLLKEVSHRELLSQGTFEAVRLYGVKWNYFKVSCFGF